MSNYNERGHPVGDALFQLATLGRLRLSVFLDGEFTSVVAALGAYMVIHHLGAAVAASGQLRRLQTVVSSSLRRTGL